MRCIQAGIYSGNAGAVDWHAVFFCLAQCHHLPPGYNPVSNDKGEKGMMVMTPRTTTFFGKV
jgi:hypothetical protein